MITANALICGKKIQLIVIKIMSLGYIDIASEARRCSVNARLLKQDGVTVRCRSLAAATVVKRKRPVIFAVRNGFVE
ncbi:hypothetical protein [Symbiopectobacterium sp. RP]|uniref:hypothetical protein n=1 Tax=Symbiopectobacterium sp. RP TaxID=3248553 RepID=UPI003D2DD590